MIAHIDEALQDAGVQPLFEHVGGDGALAFAGAGPCWRTDGGPEGRGLERARDPTPAVERTPAQHPVSRGSSGASDPGGPQSLAGPPPPWAGGGAPGFFASLS